MNLITDIRRAMQSMTAARTQTDPFTLLVPKAAFDRGEAWCREAYGVGADVEIVESVLLPRPGQPFPAPRRYRSSLRNEAN